ncbi:XRE family transcriptional regulator [Paenibacillus albiflavus]|uniref:XRE family transcriptional regulator n=1 Tax=Paenibacillus albiflavus TaxID=2545760 RepID=A0A4R4EDK0_9BACL|nr:XRE family transcriptional regulator [Paenibacillus albiflavus]
MALILGECLLPYWLEKREMNRAFFARKMGVSRATVTEWCNGSQFMTLEHAFNAADILECSIHDLYRTKYGSR